MGLEGVGLEGRMINAAILIPAAGRAARMRGRDKLLEEIQGVALLRRAAGAALGTQVPVLVTLPKGDTARQDVLAGLSVDIAAIDASEGMAASLRTGAAWAKEAAGLMIHLADMPDLESPDLAKLLGTFADAPDQVHRAASEDGVPGHPVIVPARLFPDLLRLQGDHGAREMLAKEADIRLHQLPGTRALTDLDTPEDWAAWRAKRAPSR